MSRSPNVNSSKAARVVFAASILLGGLAGLLFTTRTSSAAFTATTNNPNGVWTAATISLSDDDSATMMFNVDNMLPYDSVARCISVTYTGTASTLNPVRVYAKVDSQTNNFANNLSVKIEQGSGGSFANCIGFSPSATLVADESLASVAANHSNYASGVGTFVPATSPSTVTYRISITFNPNVTSPSAASTANATFTWEIQSA